MRTCVVPQASSASWGSRRCSSAPWKPATLRCCGSCGTTAFCRTTDLCQLKFRANGVREEGRRSHRRRWQDKSLDVRLGCDQGVGGPPTHEVVRRWHSAAAHRSDDREGEAAPAAPKRSSRGIALRLSFGEPVASTGAEVASSSWYC